MFQGNWKCSKCGGPITELPFEPRSESGLTCRACFIKSKEGENSGGGIPENAVPTDEAPPIPEDAGFASEPAPAPPEDDMGTTPAERKMFEGDWKCSGCGAAITSLPFEPRNTSNLKCLDCFKKSKG